MVLMLFCNLLIISWAVALYENDACASVTDYKTTDCFMVVGDIGSSGTSWTILKKVGKRFKQDSGFDNGNNKKCTKILKDWSELGAGKSSQLATYTPDKMGDFLTVTEEAFKKWATDCKAVNGLQTYTTPDLVWDDVKKLRWVAMATAGMREVLPTAGGTDADKLISNLKKELQKWPSGVRNEAYIISGGMEGFLEFWANQKLLNENWECPNDPNDPTLIDPACDADQKNTIIVGKGGSSAQVVFEINCPTETIGSSVVDHDGRRMRRLLRLNAQIKVLQPPAQKKDDVEEGVSVFLETGQGAELVTMAERPYPNGGGFSYIHLKRAAGTYLKLSKCFVSESFMGYGQDAIVGFVVNSYDQHPDHSDHKKNVDSCFYRNFKLKREFEKVNGKNNWIATLETPGSPPSSPPIIHSLNCNNNNQALDSKSCIRSSPADKFLREIALVGGKFHQAKILAGESIREIDITGSGGLLSTNDPGVKVCGDVVTTTGGKGNCAKAIKVATAGQEFRNNPDITFDKRWERIKKALTIANVDDSKFKKQKILFLYQMGQKKPFNEADFATEKCGAGPDVWKGKCGIECNACNHLLFGMTKYFQGKVSGPSYEFNPDRPAAELLAFEVGAPEMYPAVMAFAINREFEIPNKAIFKHREGEPNSETDSRTDWGEGDFEVEAD